MDAERREVLLNRLREHQGGLIGAHPDFKCEAGAEMRVFEQRARFGGFVIVTFQVRIVAGQVRRHHATRDEAASV